MTGTDIGSYRILDKLGEGGMGVVYKAVDTSLDRTVAIKVLSTELSRNPELVARFRNEARAQANLNHTNLATLYAFLVQDGTAAMVMEFVDGETFEQMIMRRGPIPAVEAIPLFKQALLGIGYAHRAGIIHRDIKPSNLMVNRMGIVKVMDFGIAKVMGTRGMTKTGTQMGTGWYMSPEQVLNKPVDIRSDVYSLGVTLYQMVSAHVPFEADSDFQIMSDHVHTAPPLPTKFYPYIPKGIENAILKALEKNPDARFQTVEEFGSALERPDDFVAVAAAVQAPPPVPFQAAPNPPAAQASLPQYQTPPPMASATPASRTVFEAAAPNTPPPSSPPIQQQTQPGFVPPAAPVVLLLLIGGWIALRPKPKVSTASSTQSTLPPRGTPTPLEQQISTPVSVTQLSSTTVSIPKVNTFRPHATSVPAGQTVHLSWSVSGASEVTISPGIGVVKPEGSVDIPLRKTTEFTLVAKNEKGEAASSSTTVLVEAPGTKPSATVARTDPPPQQQTQQQTQQPPPQQQAPPPPPAPASLPTPRLRPEIAFSAVPNAVQQGGSVVLRWYLSNADSASISPTPGVLRQTSGEYRVTPSESTTYTLTATSKDGVSAMATASVQVIPAAQPPPAPAQRPGAVIAVYHDHGAAFTAQNQVPPVCWGQLQIQEAKPNRVPIRNLPTFHVTVGGQHFNFIPQGMSAVQAASLIAGAAQGR